MLYFILDENKNVVEAVPELSKEQRETGNYTYRGHFKTFEQAEEVAHQLGEDKYIATDCGEWVSPRYDVIKKPRIGDKVSYAFNGDSYPCGEIEKISHNYRRVETDEGSVFWRRKKTGSWIKSGTWSLISGHRNERNPCF